MKPQSDVEGKKDGLIWGWINLIGMEVSLPFPGFLLNKDDSSIFFFFTSVPCIFLVISLQFGDEEIHRIIIEK
jgi:hypothetical protein